MSYRITVLACAVGVLSACASGGREQVATPAPGPVAAEPDAVERTHYPYTDADVAFMQGMIAHHGQALDMTALVPARSTNPTLRILAERIEQTQRNEILRMSRWLEARGETVPEPGSYRQHGAHAGHDAAMPGMLTPAQMTQLANAAGNEFDRLFLEYMIRHHEGALTMVTELHAAGGGVEPEIYIFAADVDADQRAEIARMQSLLTEIQRGTE